MEDTTQSPDDTDFRLTAAYQVLRVARGPLTVYSVPAEVIHVEFDLPRGPDEYIIAVQPAEETPEAIRPAVVWAARVAAPGADRDWTYDLGAANAPVEWERLDIDGPTFLPREQLAKHTVMTAAESVPFLVADE